MRGFFIFILCFIFIGAFGQKAGIAIVDVYPDSEQGIPTASDEVYDSEAFTGAHATFPYGTIVRILNPDNGRKINVVINDRKVFKNGVLFMISKAAASRIRLGRKAKAEFKIISWGFEGLFSDKKNSIAVNSGKRKKKGEEDKVFESKKLVQHKGNSASIYIKSEDKPEIQENNGLESHDDDDDGEEHDVSLALMPMFTKHFRAYDTYIASANKKEFRGYGLQMGVYREFNNAMKKTAMFQENWSSDIILLKKNGAYHLLIGPFPDKRSVLEYQRQAEMAGVKGYVTSMAKYSALDTYTFNSKRKGKTAYSIQIKQFKELGISLEKVEALRDNSFSDIMIQSKKAAGGITVYNILLGSYSSEEEANDFLESIRESNLEGQVVRY